MDIDTNKNLNDQWKSSRGKPQEVYRPQQKQSMACPARRWVGKGYPFRVSAWIGTSCWSCQGVTPSLSWLEGEGGYPILFWSGGAQSLPSQRGTPSWNVWGTPWEWTWDLTWPGYPQEETWDLTWLGYPQEGTWDQWKYYGMEMGYSMLTDRRLWKHNLPPSFECSR